MSKSSSALPSDQYYRACNGDMSVVEAHINAGRDINAATELKQTFLHAAAHFLHHNMAQLLLSKGANVEARSAYEMTPLMSAMVKTPTKGEDIAMLALLLSNGADIHANSEERPDALFNAVSSNKINTATFLLDHGSNPNNPNYSTNATALFVVRSVEATTLLLKHGANPFLLDSNGQTALTSLSNEVQRPFMDPAYLARHHKIAKVFERHMNWLVKEVEKRQADDKNLGEVTTRSLSTNPDKEAAPERKVQLINQQSALQEVLGNIVQQRKEEKAARAAQAAPSPSDSASSGSASSARISPRAASAAPLPSEPFRMYPSEWSYRQIELFSLAADPAVNSDARALDAYLKAKYDINAADGFKRTLLHHAAGSRNIKMAQRLLDNYPKANIDALDENGETPLHHAAGRDAKLASTHLLEHGANPFIQNRNGLTASQDQRRMAELHQMNDYSSLSVIEAHMNRLVGQVVERASEINAAAMSDLLAPQLNSNIGEISIASLSKNPTTELNPERTAQLELQQLVLKDVLRTYAQTKKQEREIAASAAQAAPSPSTSASSGSAWSARISPRAASAAPAPSAPLDHAMRSTSPSSMER